jgi:hypothetical protein
MSRYQFSLGSLLALTTIVAVAAALLAQLGLAGTLTVVFASELGMLGGMCIVAAAWHRRTGWPAGIVVGVMLLAIAAAFGFFGFLLGGSGAR